MTVGQWEEGGRGGGEEENGRLRWASEFADQDKPGMYYINMREKNSLCSALEK